MIPERIVNIIGPAPSELSDEDLYERISKERERVITSLHTYRATPAQKRSVRSEKTAMKKELEAAAKELGMSVEEILAFAKENK